MVFEIEITATVYVSVEAGGEDAARKIVQDHVCNDWLLQAIEGAKAGAGHYIVKGLSGEVSGVRPFGANPRMPSASEEDQE